MNGVTCKENYSQSAHKVTNIFTSHKKFNLIKKKRGIIFNMWFFFKTMIGEQKIKNNTLSPVSRLQIPKSESQCTQLILIFIFLLLLNQHENFIHSTIIATVKLESAQQRGTNILIIYRNVY